MSKGTKFTDITAAETKSVGFDYQYYFFLWKLLSLNVGESVGLEVKDDVHTELNNTTQILYQIKHTVQKKDNGDTINLQSSDKDLWKTLSNWIQVITDKEDSRSQKIQQLEFIRKTYFVLASNKSSSDRNIVTKNIYLYQNGEINIINLIDVFNDFEIKTKNKEIKNYISSVLSVSDDILKEFFSKVCFELDEKDIIQKCKDSIKADKIPEVKINDVYAQLDSVIREDNFIKIRKEEKIEISFDDFYLKYRRYYDLARSASLHTKQFSCELPNEIQEQTFIKQLIEIGDISADDIEDISEYTRYRLKLVNNIEDWLQKGEITSEEVNVYNNEALLKWRNEFKKRNRGLIEEAYLNEKALEVLDNTREKQVTISEQALNMDMCNGTFYNLSNIPELGWRKDWEKYKQ